MKISSKRHRILQHLRTDNLYKFFAPTFGDGYCLVNRKPVNVNGWFGGVFDESILHTYVTFRVFFENNQYKIIFEFVHKTAENKNISEYVYKKVATLNDYIFFANLLHKAPLINLEEI